MSADPILLRLGISDENQEVRLDQWAWLTGELTEL